MEAPFPLSEIRALLNAVRTLQTANEDGVEVQAAFFDTSHRETAELTSRLSARQPSLLYPTSSRYGPCSA